MQFVVLADTNATDFVSHTSVPIFRDPSPNRLAFTDTHPGAAKHDTFLYTRDGSRALWWDASARNLAQWSADIRAAVEAQGK